MNNSFKVDSVTIADYFTQDITGKGIFAGVYASELVFLSEPAFFPPLFMIVTVIPIFSQFEANIDIVTPQGTVAISFEVNFDGERQIDEFSRVAYNIQLPLLKFFGPGIYTVKVGPTGKKPVFTKRLNVIVGQRSGISLGKVGIRLRSVESPALPA